MPNNLLNRILPGHKATPSPPPKPAPQPILNKPVRTTYTSLPVAIPPNFLTTQPPDARPIVVSPIDFSKTPLPEYAGRYAVVLDHVLSPSECAQLLRLAESSVPPPDYDPSAASDGVAPPRNGEHDPWSPALLNVGAGYEVLHQSYRKSDRIIWDCQEMVDRVWGRIMSLPDVGEGGAVKRRLLEVDAEENNVVHPMKGQRPGDKWVFSRVNERMRFLKYGVGGYFKPHCDGAYIDQSDPSKTRHTIFTVHLYLNDSKQEVPGAELDGGSTAFYSFDESRKIDVYPKAGRVLIFQHRQILHSGDPVVAGTKYSVRTDIMYEYKQAEAEDVEMS